MRFHLGHRAGVNNWDLVDSSARELLGVGLIDGDRAILWELVASERLWDRRIAIVSAHALLRYAVERLPPGERARLMARAPG
jgi:3-methyladenine DNA glycosylase AlkD